MMGSFQDEIAAIRRERVIREAPTTFPSIANTLEDIECFKRDGPSVVDAICEDIRGQIRKQAKENHIGYDFVNKGILFTRFEKVNPHYCAHVVLYIKFDENVGFRYGWVKIHEENEYYSIWSRTFDHMGFSLKNPEFFIKIVEAVARQLEQDNIVSVEHKIMRDMHDPYAEEIDHRVMIPTEEQIAALNKYFAGDVSRPACRENPIPMYLRFAYFLE